MAWHLTKVLKIINEEAHFARSSKAEYERKLIVKLSATSTNVSKTSSGVVFRFYYFKVISKQTQFTFWNSIPVLIRHHLSNSSLLKREQERQKLLSNIKDF